MDEIPYQSILWRGIVLPGHEACRLYEQDSHWHLDGTAVFLHEQKPCLLTYQIVCDPAWRTLLASVEGWVGNQMVDIQLRTDSDQRWWLNEIEVPNVYGSIDLDLNFSPSTNTIPIRRLALAVGDKADVTPAWLKFPGFTLEQLPQQYHRLEDRLYRYESGGGKFVADLKVNQTGFVVDYPGIWVAEATS